jgi:hypothetical protein
MSQFVDQVLMQLHDPAQFIQLLTPATDPSHTLLQTLVAAVYDQPFATVHDVRDPQVLATEMARPLFPPRLTHGTLTQTSPAYSRTDVMYESQQRLDPVWLDLVVQLEVTLVLEVDTGQVQSLLLRDVDDITSLADFRSRFRFFDVDRFLAEEGITTVEQLRARHNYLVGAVALAPLPPFDPDAPANQRRYPLPVAVLIRDAIDLTATLRDAKLAQIAAKCSLAVRATVDTADVITPYAPLVIVPAAALGSYTAAGLQAFFAAEHILALAITPA